MNLAVLGLQLDSMILNVLSNLNDSTIRAAVSGSYSSLLEAKKADSTCSPAIAQV